MISSSPIFKRDSSGALRTWSYDVDGARWRITAGGPGRKPVTSAWTTCVGKQGRTDEQQALAEAKNKEASKLRGEYRKTEAELTNVMAGPMLAHTYEGWPVSAGVLYSQPKLDGIRAIVTKDGAFTRGLQPHLNCEHILEALAPVFAAHPTLVLDGEFYNHELKEDFGKIVSIVRKQDPTPEQRAEARTLMQYHIYDIGDGTKLFSERTLDLMNIFAAAPPTGGIIHLVDTSRVTSSDQLDAEYGRLLEDGYEGQMVRSDMPYEFDKRSKSLLKRKEFITAEFKLLRIEEGQGNWAGYAKRAVFELPDGRECGAGIKGTQEQAKTLLHNRGTWENSDRAQVTIRHFTPTPDGVPRFPVAVDFHFGGRRD